MKGDITLEAICHCQLITTKDDATLIIRKKLWSTALQRDHIQTVSYIVGVLWHFQHKKTISLP